MSPLEKQIRSQVSASGEFDFQGFKLQVHRKGRKTIDMAMGKTYPLYDLASLTKIIFTTFYFIHAHSQKKMGLRKKLKEILAWYAHDRVEVGQLLNHSAGNHWWQPFYKKIDRGLDRTQRYQQLEKLCQSASVKPNQKAIYSDIDFFILGSLMQSLENKPLSEIWDELKSQFYGQSGLHFNGGHKLQFAKTKYAPTEKCSWRKKTLQGEVHDENAWSLGGVAPHAGLFGSGDDLASYGLLLRSLYYAKKKPASVSIKPQAWSSLCASLKLFSKRSVPRAKGDWGYGFMLPSKPRSTAGQFFHESSFGHIGFTGISLWFDPKADLLVTLVSNRVHPSRDNKGFVRLRPQIHDWIMQWHQKTS